MDIFLEKLKKARKMLQLSQAQLAESVGLAQKDVSNIENGSRQYIPNQYISFLQDKGIDIVKLFDPNSQTIDFITKSSLPDENVEVFYRGNGRGISKKKELPLQNIEEPAIEYLAKGGRLVTMLTQEAAASITGIISGKYWPEEASRIMLPHTLLEQNGQYFGFKVKNDSMHPTLYDGDFVISRYLEPYEWDEIKNEHIYVISTKDDGVKIKRIRNRIMKNGFLRCRSDNKSVPAFNVEIQDISAIFEVKCRLSFNFPNEQAILYERLALIEDRIDDLERKKP